MIKLVDVLATPKILYQVSLSTLSDIVAEARYMDMLPQLESVCKGAGAWETLPQPFTQQIETSRCSFTNQKLHLEFEAATFESLFNPIGIQWIYLKGAAYQLAGFDEFDGRLMGDIDILVSESDLPVVEKLLSSQGWIQTPHDDYDEQFYRDWSQEIPPLRHIERQSELDLHFNILPKTLKESPNTDLLFSQTVSLSIGNVTGAYVLTPSAMVIHSAIHLFYESEYRKGLRDLHDLYLLFGRFGKQPHFWEDLLQLQNKLGSGRPVYYALRYCQELFNLSVPEDVKSYYNQFKPNTFKLIISDFAFKRVFSSMYPPHRRPGHDIAEFALYLRGHFKRMPVYLLIPHLFRKTLKKITESDDDKDRLTV